MTDAKKSKGLLGKIGMAALIVATILLARLSFPQVQSLFSGDHKATNCIRTTVEGPYKIMRNGCSTTINAIVCENWMGRPGLGICDRKNFAPGREIANMAADDASVLTHVAAPSSVHILACRSGYTAYFDGKPSTSFYCSK